MPDTVRAIASLLASRPAGERGEAVDAWLARKAALLAVIQACEASHASREG